jgi:hypothetical protein
VVAVCSLGKDPVVSHSSELMRLGKMPSAAQLKEGLDILSVKLHGNLSLTRLKRRGSARP